MGAFVALIVLLLFSFSSAQCPYSETGLQSFNTLYPSVTSADNIVISTKVLLDVSSVTARWINITKGGQLIFKDMAINLNARLIFVGDGGALRIGSPACPLKSNIVITLTGAYSNQSNMIDEIDRILMGTKGIGVSSGGSIDVHGVSPQPTWTRLSKHADQNSTTISLQKSVDWKVGSSIVIASTDFPGVYLGGSSTADPASFIPYTSNQWAPQPLPPNQNEERIIVSISNDRRTITLDSPLNFTHYGLGDMSAEVGLLSRNIKIQGDDESETEFFGGHIMIRNVVAARFTAVELYHMGQKGVVGRYPIHFHLMGSGIDPTNRYIKDSSVHDVYQRCIVIHTSHGVMVKNNVAFKANGHCYFLEDGPETYNTFDGNLGILALPIYAADPDGVSRRIIVADAAPSIFWIVNPNNTVTNNVAVEAQNGFWYALPDAPVGISVDCCPGLVPKNIPLLSFKDNVAHSTGSGLFVDKGIMHSTPAGMVNAKTNYAPTVPAYFDGLIAYKNRDFGIWTQSENVHVINAKLYDNKVAARMIAGRNSLQNAIVIAETDNLGVPAASNRIRSRPLRYDSELVGWMFYDHGSQSIRNVSFIGFNTTKERSANAINFPCQPHPHNSFMRLENVRYLDSISFRIPNITTCYLNSGNDNLKAVNVMDTDGSTTGWVGGWIVSNLDIHKYAGCVPIPEWLDGAKCPPTFEGYVRTAINVALANVPPSDNSSLPTLMKIVPLEQPGSASLDLAGDETMDGNRVVTGYNFATNLKNTRTYLVRWLSNYVSTRVNLRMGEYGQPGEWVILVFPYPKSAALSFVGSYTSVNSLSELVSSTYFYDSSKELLYVRLSIEEENNSGRPRGNWANWAHYSTGSGITLSIIANCSSSSSSDFCRAPASNAPGFSVSIPPRREQAFRADLTTCGSSQSVSYRDDIELSGTAFLSYDPKTARLSYHIVHNIGLNVTKMLVQYQQNPGLPATVELELPALPVAPIKGFTYLSKTSHQRLVAGKLRIVFTTDASPNGVLFGYFGCVGTCSLPEKAVNVSTCASVTNTTIVDIYSNGNFAKLQQAWAGNNAYVIAPTNDSVEGVCGGSKPIKAFISNGYLNIGANTVVPNLESKFKFLEFWIKADIPNSGQPDLFVLLRNTTQIGNKVRIEKSHLLGHAITSDWTRVRIPLSDFDVTSSIAFRYLQFSQVFPNNARPIYYFDQIRFSSIGDSAPIQDPSAPTTVSLYSSNLCSVTVTEDESSTTSPTSTTSPSFDQSSASLVYVAAHLIVVGILASLF